MVKKLLVLLLVVPLCTIAAEPDNKKVYNSRSAGYRLEALVDFDNEPRGMRFGNAHDETIRNLADTVAMLNGQLRPLALVGGTDHFIDTLANFTDSLTAEVENLKIALGVRMNELAVLRALVANSRNDGAKIIEIVRGKAILSCRVECLESLLEEKEKDIKKLVAMRKDLLAQNNNYALVVTQQEGIISEVAAVLEEITTEGEATRVAQEDFFEAQAAAQRMHLEQARAEKVRSDAEKEAFRLALENSAAREAALQEQLRAAQIVPSTFVVRFSGMGGLFERTLGGEGSLS